MATADQLREAILAQNPTDQQREAIFAEELEFLLRAAPGSGKTWTSCRRFIWRAANWPHPVGGLALLSFTNAAIREFKTATINVGRRDLISDPNYVGTFDSFVERYILAPFGHLLTGADKRPKLFPGPRLGDWNNPQLKVWKDGRGGQKIPVRAWEVIPYPDGTKLRFKASPTSEDLPLAAADHAVHKLLSLGFYTHAQRVFWACKLLFKRPHIAELLAKRFPEMIVDEAQDSNAWLLVLLNFLREKGTQVTLVGDPDQCIYEFSMADATSLLNLKAKWSIPEKPLSQSFRCNNQIAAAVRKVGGNAYFTGAGDGASEWRQAFVVKETSTTLSDGLAAFQRLAGQAGVSINSAAVVGRGHKQLESLRGKANYAKLTGKAKGLATAAFLRDSRHDYRVASQTVERIVRELTGDDPLWERIDTDPNSRERTAVALAIWKFVKSPDRLTPVSQLGDTWIPTMRTQLASLIEEIGLQCGAKLGQHIKATGLSAAQKALPLFESVHEFPEVRQDTIHQVKGESINAVLVIGSTRFWNSVMAAVRSGDNTEDRRLAYVAMTRARHLLVVGLPKEHYDKHSKTWVDWGFRAAT
ncbi:MAG: ATP-dependent helicase [Gammaproteobacteria bacterium]|nr:ATP-dependent helicase [Gammaproteobacteria bacterium]